MNLLEELKEYGFSEKEARVYLTVLELGSATANEIAEKTDLIRTTAYDILKLLREKGLVSTVNKNNVLTFEASDPSKLTEILEEKINRVNKIIPNLSKLKKEKYARQKVEFYEGKEGLKTAFEEILKAKKPLHAYSNNEMMLHALPFYSTNFIKRRVEDKIPLQILSEDSPTTRKLLVSKDKKEFRETRLLEELKNISINQYIFDDSVAILNSKEGEFSGIIIRNKEFSDCQKLIFEKLWKNAKKNNS